MQNSAGIPGQYCGQQSEIIENDRLVATKNVLQKTYISFQEKQGQAGKATKKAGRKATGAGGVGAAPTQREPVNDVQALDGKLASNRDNFGTRNANKQFVETADNIASGRPMPGGGGNEFTPEVEDERILALEGRKKTFDNGTKTATGHLYYQQLEKYLQKKNNTVQKEGQRADQEDPKIKAARQKEQIAIAKDLFLLWDADGEGSLSANELIKAFVKIGLSQDHRFANKIIAAINPNPDVMLSDTEIKIKDFISVFKDDELSDKLIERINEEIHDDEMKEQNARVARLKRKVKEGIAQKMRMFFVKKDTAKEGSEYDGITPMRRLEMQVEKFGGTRNSSFDRTGGSGAGSSGGDASPLMAMFAGRRSSAGGARSPASPQGPKEDDEWFTKHAAKVSKKRKNQPPTLGQQSNVIEVWWKQVKKQYVDDANLLARIEAAQSLKDDAKVEAIDERLVIDVPVNAVTEFLVNKRCVVDRQNAIKLLNNQLGSFDDLQRPNLICFDEFLKIFCRGMFKQALINTIEKLQRAPTPLDGGTSDQAEADEQDMPLAMKIERYQRARFLNGLDAKAGQRMQNETANILASLNMIIQQEDEPDEMIQLLRKRSKEAFLADPLGAQFEAEYLRAREALPVNDFNMRIKLLEEVDEGHRGNVPMSLTDYKLAEGLEHVRKLKQGVVDDQQKEDADALKKKTKRSQYERDKAVNSSIGTELKTLAGKRTNADTKRSGDQSKL